MVYLELMRYRNCAMAGLAAVIGGAIAYSVSPGELLWMGLIFITVFVITGAGNAINDYFD
ncbi:MAG: digeranylgeranylglyceryl phosphate synthase, partial [Candidatus Methanoperedens sp.]|nr:digeranylgeranylglyceryl phosphate synthase [Candidatus Methanoperedens sp.]